MKNLICTIEARMGSKRLPGKCMMTLSKNYRLIDFVILNALKSNYLSKKNNFKLINYIKNKYDLKIITGSEKNVLNRYLKLEKHNSTVLRLTADNPMIDPNLIDKSILYFKKSNADYASSRPRGNLLKLKIKNSYPKGISLEFFKMKTLLKFRKKFNKRNWEYPTWFFYNKTFKGKTRKIKLFEDYSNVGNFSFTIDTKQDLERLKKLITKYRLKPGENNFKKYVKNFK